MGLLHGVRANPREGHCQSCDKLSAAAFNALFVLAKRFAVELKSSVTPCALAAIKPSPSGLLLFVPLPFSTVAFSLTPV